MSARKQHSRPSADAVFEILVRQNADMLTAYLRSLVIKSDVVDELFQETMLVAWRRLGTYDRSRPFGPWLRGIAVRLVLAERRRARRGLLNCDPAVLETLEGYMQDLDRMPDDVLHERLKRLRGCMERLPGPMRDAVDLGYGRALLLREIAAALDASVEAVKKRVQRARELLLQCMNLADEAP